MKLPLPKLEEQLQKKLSPVYLISGDEFLLVQEARDLIRIKAKHAGFDELIRLQAEGTDWAKNFLQETQNLSLFSAKKVIELDLTSAKLTAASSKIFQEYSQAPQQDIIVILLNSKLDSKSEQASWYKALDKIGVMIPIWPIPLEQLPQWLTQRAKKLGLTLTKEAAEFVATHVEGNLLAASQELEKILLLQPNTQVTLPIIETLVTDNSHFDVFSLVDSVLAGNQQRSLRILDNLAAEDTEPAVILWALTRELRTLAEIIKQLQQGIMLGSLFPKFRIFEKRQPSVRAFLQRFKLPHCWEFLLKAASLDNIIKGAEKANIWNELRGYVLKMSSSAA